MTTYSGETTNTTTMTTTTTTPAAAAAAAATTTDQLTPFIVRNTTRVRQEVPTLAHETKLEREVRKTSRVAVDVASVVCGVHEVEHRLIRQLEVKECVAIAALVAAMRGIVG